MSLGHGASVVRNGLVLHLDAANLKSFNYQENFIKNSDMSGGSGTTLPSSWICAQGFGNAVFPSNISYGTDSLGYGFMGFDLIGGPTTTSNRLLIDQRDIVVSANTLYTISFNYFLPAAWLSRGAGITVQMLWYDSLNNFISASTSTLYSNSQITRVSFTGTSPANTAKCAIRFDFSGTVINGESISITGFRIGGVQLERGTGSGKYTKTTTSVFTSSTAWNDLSGNSNNGTLTNGPTYKISNGGQILFDGTDDTINCGPVPQVGSSLTGLTVSVWINTNNASTRLILENGNSYTTNTFYLAQENANYFTFEVYGNSNFDVIYANYVYQTNTWYNLVGTWASGALVNLYTNGILTNGTRQGAGARTNLINGNTNLFVGSRAGTSFPFSGNIGDVKIYSRALSNTEIIQNFEALRGRYGI